MKTFFCIGSSAFLGKDFIVGSLEHTTYNENVEVIKSYLKYNKSDLLQIAQEDYEGYEPLDNSEKFLSREKAIKCLNNDCIKYNILEGIFILLEIDIETDSVIGVEQYIWNKDINEYVLMQS